jgi:hypothetical protein
VAAKDAGLEDQRDFYLRRGLAGGLNRAQSTEALTHLGFYAPAGITRWDSGFARAVARGQKHDGNRREAP